VKGVVSEPELCLLPLGDVSYDTDIPDDNSERVELRIGGGEEPPR
jgi:hypothetical protein